MMKKFTLLIVSCLICFALASCQKTEPEPECKLKDFPYEIDKVEKMTLYIASEKYHHPDLDWSEEELYEIEYYYLLKFQPDQNWDWYGWPITDFQYEKGYEYIIEGLCIDYIVDGDMVFRTFQCCKILSKQKKQSEGLPSFNAVR